MKAFHPDDYAKYLIIITDRGSALEDYARTVGCELLTIEPQIGGRFSVFTAVGLFPLMMLGIDTESFCSGATQAVAAPEEAGFTAATIYGHYKKGYLIHDLFFSRLNLLCSEIGISSLLEKVLVKSMAVMEHFSK